MNFIYSIGLWLILFLVTTISKNAFNLNENWTNFLVGAQVVFVAMSIIFAIVCFFYQLSERSVYIETINQIKRHQKECDLKKEKYEEVKEYLIKYFAENYPQFEKDIFLKVSENSKSSELGALLQNFPKLKSSKVFEQLINKLTSLIGDIYESKKDIEWHANRLENVLTNPWVIFKPKRYEI